MQFDLAEWLQRANIEVEPARLAARRAAAEQIAKSFTLQSLHELVSVSRNPGSSRPEAVAQVAQVIRGQDSTFVPSSGRTEIAIVASAAIAIACANSESPKNSALLALWVSTYDFQGWRTAEFSGFLEGAAEVKLKELSMALRSAQSLNAAAPTIRAVGGNPDPGVIGGELKQFSEETAGAIDSGFKYTTRLAEREELLREELNALWWLFNSFSDSIDVPFEELPPAIAPFVLGVELAGLIAHLPGPVASTAMLRRALSAVRDSNGVLSALDLALLLPDAMRAPIAKLNAAKNQTCPLHALIAHVGEVSGMRDALAKWSDDNLRFDANAPRSAHGLARQAYRERLVLAADNSGA